jgi:hypothetical protein
MASIDIEREEQFKLQQEYNNECLARGEWPMNWAMLDPSCKLVNKPNINKIALIGRSNDVKQIIAEKLNNEMGYTIFSGKKCLQDALKSSEKQWIAVVNSEDFHGIAEVGGVTVIEPKLENRDIWARSNIKITYVKGNEVEAAEHTYRSVSRIMEFVKTQDRINAEYKEYIRKQKILGPERGFKQFAFLIKYAKRRQ